MFVRRTLRWSLALILDAAVFAGVWWLCQTWLGNSEGDALAIAGVVAAIALAPAAWWAGREPNPTPEQPSHAPGTTVRISGNIFHGPAALQGSGTQHNTFNNFSGAFGRNRIAGSGCAAIVLLILGTLAHRQRIVDVATYPAPLTGILVTILSSLCLLARRGFGTVTIVITSIIATAAITVTALAGVWWVQTEPGRSAARVANGWRVAYPNTFVPDEPRVHNTVDMRISQGPADAACLLMFGYRDPNNWYALRVLQGEQHSSQSWSVIRSEGAGPLPFYGEPTANQSIDLNSWASAAIKANDDSFNFFITNRLVVHNQKIDRVRGVST